jgi:hypothetical protein
LPKANESATRPLGLLPGVVLREGLIHSFQKLENFDLGPVRDRIIRTEVLPSSLVDDATFELRRYLAVRLVTGRPVSMLSRPVDSVWHSCLLFTRLYAELCESVFGSFVHHDPSTESIEALESGWSEFESEYTRLFGPPGPLWQLWRPDLR